MKKTILLAITLITSLLLLAACTYLCVNYLEVSQKLAAANEQTTYLLQENTDLQESLSKSEEYAQSQNAYVEELTQQLNMMTGFLSEELDEDEESDRDKSSYQEKYPELYAQAEFDKRYSDGSEEKYVYLTFDDGPSSLTPKVLDLLDEYNAKATFFVVYKEEQEYTEYLSEIVDRGHTLALHSYSHNYGKIYASVDAFLEDFQKVYDWVYEETGQRPTLFRFPGGSTNGKKAVTTEIVNEMQRRGFIYYDWNVSSGDGSQLTTTENIYKNICSNVGNFEFPVVLMHDGPGKNATLRALPDVLKTLKDKGYTFRSLDETMTPVQYRRSDSSPDNR